MFKDWIRRVAREAFHELHAQPTAMNIVDTLRDASTATAMVYAIDNGYLVHTRSLAEHTTRLTFCEKIEDVGVELAKHSFMDRLRSPQKTALKIHGGGGGVGMTYPASAAAPPNYAPMPTISSP